MLRFILTVILSMLLAAPGAFFIAWWMVALAPLLVSLAFRMWPKRAFWAGFISILLLWGALAFRADMANEHVLAGRMAPLLGLPSYGFFLLAVALLGGLLGGLGAWSGAHLSAIFRSPMPPEPDSSVLPDTPDK